MTETPRRWSRRRFLGGLGVAAGAAALGGYGVSVWSPHGERTAAGPTPRSGEVAPGRAGRTLVILELAGGNDALDMVVPLDDGRYHDLRPTLGVTDPLEVGDGLGLHPALTTVASEYRAGRVAVVEGVGYPAPDLSHFASLAVWWTADPDARRGGRGWIGRYLDATVGYDDPLAAVTIGPGPSPALIGARSFATSIADARGLQPTLPTDPDVRDALLAAWARLAPTPVDGVGALGTVREAIAATVDARERLASMLPSATTASAARGAAGDRGLAAATSLAARLAAAASAPRVVLVRAPGDFDTHQGQAQRYPVLVADLDGAVAAFVRTLEGLGASRRAVLMTTSEFGRRARENGSGTDHGTAAAHLVVGAGVVGGRHGEPPDLAHLDESGNLRAAVDVRAYYAALLHGWLGVEAGPVLGGGFEPLPRVVAAAD